MMMQSHAIASTPPAGRFWPMALLAIAATLSVLVAAMSGWKDLVLLAFVGFAVVFARYPTVGLVTLAAAIPFHQWLVLDTGFGEAPITRYVTLALIAGVAPAIIRRRDVVFDRLAGLYLLVVVSLIASIGAPGVETGSWAAEVGIWALAGLTYVLIRSMQPGVRVVRPILIGLALGVFGSSLLALQQFLTDSGPEAFIAGGRMRVYGPFDHPNQLAAYLAILLPLLTVAGIRGAGWSSAWSIWTVRAGILGGWLVLILTQSRAGWLAAAAAVVVILALSERRVQRAVAVGAVGLVLLAVATGVAATVPGIDRFAAISINVTEETQVTPATWGQLERQAHWGAAWSMLHANPLFGVGAGGFDTHFREHTPVWRFRIPRGHAHSGFLHMGAQAGVPGLVAFMAWVCGAILMTARLVRRAPGLMPMIAAGVLAGMTAYVIQSGFEYLSVAGLPVLVALLLALVQVNGAGGVGMERSL